MSPPVIESIDHRAATSPGRHLDHPNDRAPARWARWAAWTAIACVVPSGVWRIAVGVGVDLGWSQRQLELQQMPGAGTVYVIALTVLSLAAAGMTVALVRPWSERFPAWVPLVGGRPIPLSVVLTVSIMGTIAVLAVCVMSVVNWDRVSGFADQPGSGWAVLMAACYLPALLWGPLLLIVTGEHWWRRRRTGSES